MVCPNCARECECIGYKIRIPPARDQQAWESLRDSLRAASEARSNSAQVSAARRRHEIEREIAKLEARPEDPERVRLIQRLRRTLAGH